MIRFAELDVTRRWRPIGEAVTTDTIAARPGPALRDPPTQIIIGDTGIPGRTARAASADLGQAFGHFLVDDRDIIECVPAITSAAGRRERAGYFRPRGQTGDPAPDALVVNLCYGGGIERGPAYERWAGLIAALSLTFRLPPYVADSDPPLADVIKTAAALAPGRNDPAPALKWAGHTIDDFYGEVGVQRARLASATLLTRPTAVAGERRF